MFPLERIFTFLEEIFFRNFVHLIVFFLIFAKSKDIFLFGLQTFSFFCVRNVNER